MAAGNIADRHAGLHCLGNHGQLQIRRKPPPARAGDDFHLRERVGRRLYPGLCLDPPAKAGIRSNGGHFNMLASFASSDCHTELARSLQCGTPHWIQTLPPAPWAPTHASAMASKCPNQNPNPRKHRLGRTVRLAEQISVQATPHSSECRITSRPIQNACQAALQRRPSLKTEHLGCAPRIANRSVHVIGSCWPMFR